MGTLRNIEVSLVEYRPDPSLPTLNTVPLTVVVAFEFRGREYFWLKSRTQFESRDLALMDDVHRRLLLDQPGQYVLKRFRQAMSASRRAEEVFENFSTLLRGSIAASPGVRLEASKAAGVSSRDNIKRLVDDVVRAFMKGANASELPRLLSRSPATETGTDSFVDLPPWLIDRAGGGAPRLQPAEL